MSTDDKQLFKIVRDLSGGINTGVDGSLIGDNQATNLQNVALDIAGETSKIKGITLVEDLGNDAGTGLYGFMPSNGAAELIATHGTKLETWGGSSTFAERKTDFTAGIPTTLLKCSQEGEGDVLLCYVTGNHWFRMLQDHTFQDCGNTVGTGSDSPPLSHVALWFRQRMWVLKDNLLYYSEPYPADFAICFNTATDAYKVEVGAERALLSIRDQGIIILGSDAIYGINPSTIPDAADKVEKMFDMGCVAGKSATQIGDDIVFMAPDGVRMLYRSINDKFQSGESYPISLNIQDAWDSLNWAYISKASGVYFDNKYFLSVPVNASTYNNQVWVYYPATKSWTIIEGWNVADWAKITFGGQERLYAIDSNDGKVYRAWYGGSNNGVAIEYIEEGKKDDFGKPLITKSGGEVRIKVATAGNYTLDVYAEADNNGYTYLGAIDLTDQSPILPVNLPFQLSNGSIVTHIFHLDSLGEFKTLRLKLVQSTDMGSDEMRIYERSVITYVNEYQSE